MKTFCIVFIISAWAYFLVWMHRRIENKGMKLGIPVLTLASFFFCCMGVRAVPAKLLFIPAVVLALALGTCLFMAVLDRKKDMNWKRIAFIAGCAVCLTALMYTDSRITVRDDFLARPKPKLQNTEDFGTFYDPENPPIPPVDILIDGGFTPPEIESPDSIIMKIQGETDTLREENEAAEAAALAEAEEKLKAEQEAATQAEAEEQKELAKKSADGPFTVAVSPYKITAANEGRFVTFDNNPALVLQTSDGPERAKEGIFKCRVVDVNGEPVEDAIIDIKYLYPENRDVCSFSHLGHGDGSYTVTVYPIRAGSACLEVSSPKADMACFVLVVVSDGGEAQ